MPSIGEVTPWWTLLDEWRSGVRAPRLRTTLALFYDDPGFRGRFEECPASLSGHHAELGGLLKHTCEVAAIGRRIAEVCGADVDLVLAGILLHDIGKVESYRWEGCFEMTTAGSLLGHIVLGALMLDRRLEQEAGFPCSATERTILHHLILSHHGKLEFGAPVYPMTLEAEVIHYADNASAKTRAMADALTTEGNFPDEGSVSSRGIWQLDRRRIYRGTSDWGLEQAD
jgi:3'-5' exoribonuclease